MKRIIMLLIVLISICGCSSTKTVASKEYDEIVDLLELDVSNCTKIDLLQFMKESYVKTFEGNGVGEAFVCIDDLDDGTTVYDKDGIKINYASKLYGYYKDFYSLGDSKTSGFNLFINDQYAFSFVYYIKEYEHKLSNGDKVFIDAKTFNEHDGIDLRTLVEQYSIYPANSEKEYKVQGLKEIITKKEDVNISAVLNTMNELEKGQNDYLDSIHTESADYNVEIQVHNIYWLIPKDSYFYGKYAFDKNTHLTYGYYFCDIQSVVGVEYEYNQSNGEHYFGIAYIFNPYKGDTLYDAYSATLSSSHEVKANAEMSLLSKNEKLDYSSKIEEMKEMYDVIQLN